MEIYEWDGFWGTSYDFKLLNPKEKVEIEFEDEIPNNEYTPTTEQYQAITYIINHQEQILSSFLNHINSDSDYQEIYGDYLPNLASTADLLKEFYITKIYVNTLSKDGISYTGFSCECEWDPEHGIGFYLHKDRIIDCGEAMIGYYGSNLISEDAGRIPNLDYDEVAKTMFVPHPIYDTKPSQDYSNDKLLNQIIGENRNDEFIHLVETKQILLDYPYPFNGYEIHLFDRVCKLNNVELVEFLIKKGVKVTEDCLSHAICNFNRYMIGLLLDNGAEINDGISFRSSAFGYLVAHIGWLHKNDKTSHIPKAKKLLDFLIKEGANPFDENDEKAPLHYLEGYIEDDKLRDEMRAYIIKISKNRK